jgi:hypothetical protein
MRVTIFRASLLAAVVLTSQPRAAAGQQLPLAPDWRETGSAGFGYAGNLPRALLGASAHVLLPRMGGIGLYGEFKITHESRRGEGFLPDVTVEQAETEFGDDFVRELEHWYVANLAVLRPITRELALYIGTGYARRTLYREYFDVSGERGSFGHYRVEDPADSGSRIDLIGGGFFRAGRRVAFHFGAELAPPGFTVGASLLFPLR